MMDSRYRQIAAVVDAEFRRNQELHGERIHCRSGCTDCCHHLFRITGLEAASIAEGVRQLPLEEREAIRARSREYEDARRRLPGAAGGDAGRLPPAGTRLACPALDQGVCTIYEFRPLICRKFGMPLYNPDQPGRIFACQLNFRDGEEIVDSELIPLQTRIHESWKQLQSEYLSATDRRDGSSITVAQAILQDES